MVHVEFSPIYKEKAKQIKAFFFPLVIEENEFELFYWCLLDAKI